MNDSIFIATVYTEPGFYIVSAEKRQYIPHIKVGFDRAELENWVENMKRDRRVKRTRIQLLTLSTVKYMSISDNHRLSIGVPIKGGVFNNFESNTEHFVLDIPENLIPNVEKSVSYYNEFIAKYR